LSWLFFSFFGLIGLLLILFLYSARNPRPSAPAPAHAGVADESGRRHVTYLPQILQAFAETDYDFLSKNAPRKVQQRVRQERRHVALVYLAGLREDFENLLRMARAIALLSPELAAVHEFERLRLTAAFLWRYQMIRWKLLAGVAPAPQLAGLSDLVSGLSVRIEGALKELGERAAVAAELASSVNRRRLDVV